MSIRSFPEFHAISPGFLRTEGTHAGPASPAFRTLEDETGFVNVVLWPKVWARHRVLVKTSPLLGVTGRLESQQGVAHLIADHIWLPRLTQPVPTGGSRDFQ